MPKALQRVGTSRNNAGRRALTGSRIRSGSARGTRRAPLRRVYHCDAFRHDAHSFHHVHVYRSNSAHDGRNTDLSAAAFYVGLRPYLVLVDHVVKRHRRRDLATLWLCYIRLPWGSR